MIQPVSTEIIDQFFPELNSLGFLRLDLPDPIAGGNKSYKLKYHLQAYRAARADAILSFGGAYSNHIAALAYAGKQYGIPTIGVIRGEELNANSNPVLRFASECGMKLHFVSRREYRLKDEAEATNDLRGKYGSVYVVPEGGGGEQGVQGCLEILNEAANVFDEIVLPVGTGTTITGIIQSAKEHQHVSGIAVVAAKDHLEGEIEKMMQKKPLCTWNLVHDYTLGGYANTSDELNEFIYVMSARMDLPLDPVYSGKTLFALHRMTNSGSFRGKNVLFVHTGGYAFVV